MDTSRLLIDIILDELDIVYQEIGLHDFDQVTSDLHFLLLNQSVFNLRSEGCSDNELIYDRHFFLF